jgi:hypothetical protein
MCAVFGLIGLYATVVIFRQTSNHVYCWKTIRSIVDESYQLLLISDGLHSYDQILNEARLTLMANAQVIRQSSGLKEQIARQSMKHRYDVAKKMIPYIDEGRGYGYFFDELYRRFDPVI